MSPKISAKDQSTIGPTTTITGNIAGRGDLHLHGKVHGSVRIDGDLELAPEAVLEGPAEGANVTVLGAVSGDISASGTVSFGPGSSYSGVISAAAVTIAAGARIDARLDTDFDLHLNI